MLDLADLKFVIEHLASPSELDEHPLADAQFVVDYIQQHPEKRSLSKGKCLGWALADLWRTRFQPSHLAPEAARDWNRFLSLEVGYFYPFRHNAFFPSTPAQISRALSDKEDVAQVIADGDSGRAREIQQKYDDFWKEILPKKDQVVADQTMRSRRESAMKLLLKKLRGEAESSASAPGTAGAEAHEPSAEPGSPPNNDSKSASWTYTFPNALLLPEWSG